MKRLSVWIGRVLAVASVAFVAWLLWRDGSQHTIRWSSLWFPLVLAALAYAFCTLLVTRAWFELLRALGDCRVSWDTAWVIYGRSQLAKYLPGNVLHLAGRHLLGRRTGITHGVLAGSAVAEGLLLLGAALLVGISISPNLLDRIQAGHWQMEWLWLAAAGAVAVVAAVLFTLKRLSFHIAPASLIRATGLYCLFFLAAGSIAAMLASHVGATNGPASFAHVIGAFALAWAAGFAVPGAPGGIGVREATLVVLLTGLAPQADLVWFAVALRLVTLGGDLLLFAAACARGTRPGSQTTDLIDQEAP